RIPVEIGDGSEIERLRAQLASLDNKRVQVSVSVRGVAQAVRKLAALDKAVRNLDGRNIDIKVDIDGLAAATAGLAGVTAATVGARGPTRSFGAVGLSTFASVSSEVANMPGMLLASTAVAAGLAVVGAGITAAWGAVSTAIAAVPAALALVGVPLALVIADTE